MEEKARQNTRNKRKYLKEDRTVKRSKKSDVLTHITKINELSGGFSMSMRDSTSLILSLLTT